MKHLYFLPILLWSIFILALTACDKESSNLNTSSEKDIPTETKNRTNKSPQYYSLGDATISGTESLIIEDIGSSGNDGISINVESDCNIDGILSPIDLEGNQEFMISSHKASGDLINKLGLKVNSEGNYFPILQVNENYVGEAIFKIVNIDSTVYSDTIVVDSSTALGDWSPVFAFLRSIEDYHIRVVSDIIDNKIVRVKTTTISFNSDLSTGGGGYFNTPDGEFYGDRISIVTIDDDFNDNDYQVHLKAKNITSFEIDEFTLSNCQ